MTAMHDEPTVVHEGEALLDLHGRMLERLGAGVPLPVVLNSIAAGIEALLPENRCVILLLDSERGVLRCGAAPSVADPWRDWIDDLEVGPLNGSCGCAVHRREPVVVHDIAEDSRYVGAFRQAALDEGIRGSWSTPIVAGNGRSPAPSPSTAPPRNGRRHGSCGSSSGAGASPRSPSTTSGSMASSGSARSGSAARSTPTSWAWRSSARPVICNG
jgi:hypothetical protein